MTAGELYVYDIETFPNCFTLAAQRRSDGARWFYEISERRDDRQELIAFFNAVRNTNGRMVGFNNETFDYYVLHQIVTDRAPSYPQIYRAAMEIIDCKSEFPPKVWPSDILVPQIDLYKINHFDNKARRTGLKVLEFNMRSKNVDDLPFEPGTWLTFDQMDTLGIYNIHDVNETMKFLEFNLGKLTFRDELSGRYGKDFTNFNDTKIGKQYFIMKLEESVPGICYNPDKSPRQTVRSWINLAEAVFPWVEFRTPQFQHIVSWLKGQSISETKGVFSDLSEAILGPAAEHAKMRVKKRRIPEDEPLGPGEWEHRAKNGNRYRCWNQADALNTTVDGFNFVFGTGGIHGSIESQIVYSDLDHIIIDLDVASYYPNLAIANRLYPEHLGEKFFAVYKDLYEQRKAHPKKKFPAINAMLKLALNGVYGDSNNQYSPFYDPLYTMSITINGQLLLCKLAEDLMVIPGLSMVQINTDGLTVKVPRVAIEQLREACSEWEHRTGLELEEVAYSRMFIRDVNNYIGEYEDGSLKRKGAYAYETPLVNPNTGEVGWHNDHSALVVAKAAEAHMVRGESIEQFVRQHDDIYDFMLRAKVDRSSMLVINYPSWGDTDFPLQRITRYYVTDQHHGGHMVKVMPPLPKKPGVERRIGQCAGEYVQPCNNMADATAPINYDYYINEARKLCEPLRDTGRP